MRQKKIFLILALLCAIVQGAWAQNGIYCTASDKNRVVCTDGTIYDNVAAATADGKTAAAMIIYIDESNKAGLALALRDEGQYTQADGITACNNKNTSMPVVGGTWKLANKSEWDSMISAAGGSPTLHDGFSSVGGTNMDVRVYWSSEIDGSNGLLLQYSMGWSDFVSNSQSANIRACLKFNLLTLYEIGSQSEWNVFCTAVNTGSTLYGNTFSDKYVKLTSDISVSEMAGSSESNSFQGLFDGDGHTLTVSYNTEYAVTAPFRYVNNATIRNLKTTGTITTSAMCAAGIVGDVTGSLNLISCSSSVSISSRRGDIDTHGGLVASNGGNVTISSCVFDGSFAATVAHTNSYGTTFCGGIVGMCNENTSTTITNSLVAPSSVSEGMINETFVGLYNGATVTIDNCYFVETANLPTNQGTQVYYTAPANEISKSITISSTTVYSDACSVSGVEAAYDLNQGLVFITPTVTDPFAATLTFGTDYTATMDGDAVQSLPVSISTAGNYTLVLTGAGSYTGSKTCNITATGDPVNSALAIGSEAEWDTFAESVNNGTNYSNQFVKLTADISVSTMVGTSETNSFQGTFLGDGTHTLTFTKGIAESAFGEENCAPFRYVKNATIRDLKVTGDIYTSRKFAAGLVARNSGETNITNCQVGTVIHSSVSGDGTHGGIVAMPAGSTTTTITGCVYNGRLLTTSSTTYCGGFVGWSGNNTVTVAHSLYAPDANIAVAQGETAIDNGATFVRGNSPTIGTNCYYTATMGNTQGTRAYSITPATGITIENTGEVNNEYNVSGLTFYTTGFKCGDVHCAGSGDQLSLTLTNTATAPDGYRYDSYNASAGTLSGSDADGWILLMPDEDVTISLGTLAPIDWATQSDGTAADPYLLYNKDQLDLLAHRVNGTHGETANDYSGKHFRLEADIAYTHGDSDTESNYEAIGGDDGTNDRYFRGTFDGQNHVVSGIRIYKGGDDNADRYQGLFGQIGSPAEVKSVILTDATITGYDYTGTIVGYNNGGTVTGCHALADVTVHTVKSNVYRHGGIAGYNDGGTVTRCTSAAALTTAGSNSSNVGGIAGRNHGTVTDCIYLGNTLAGASCVGAIEGSNDGTVRTSYYTDTAIQGKDNSGNDLGNTASAVGCNDGGTVATTVGPALRDDADNSGFLALMAARNATLTAAGVTTTATVGLSGRTLYKDGAWNTLCLPFSLDNFTGTPLEGATVKTLASTGFSGGTLTMNFSDDVTSIEAGKPYIVKWANGTDIVNPVFKKVFISDATANAETDYVDFVGTYRPVSISSQGDNTKLFLSSNNTLYYPNAAMTIGSQRAYFQLKQGLTAGEPSDSNQGSVRAFVLNFGDDDNATGILTTNFTNPTNSGNEWYSIDGRKLSGKPTQRGIYINNGKRVVIK